MLLGCIGDDFTGSSDIANTLAKRGMRVAQYTGVPARSASSDVEAGVVALKTRTEPVAEAVSKSLAAADWLLDQGCGQIVFKYCSTFDSTRQGNIGPVAQALAERLGEDRVIVCPAFPATGRSIYKGHLFVSDQLLSESGMRDHPLTPMTDSDIRRWLSHQTGWPVDHIDASTVFDGSDAIRAALAQPKRAMVVVDAIRDEDLVAIGKAAKDRKLLTGGSGIALGLPDNFADLIKGNDGATVWKGADGPAIVLSGSCSLATRGQVTHHIKSHPSLEIRVEALVSGEQTADSIASWLIEHQDHGPIAYSSADPGVVRQAQDLFGREASAEQVEATFVSVARKVVGSGIRKIITAGGETSGAVVEGLEINSLAIGPEIAPGVPAVHDPDQDLYLALKSGNFGQEDFFARAMTMLERGST
ncbi:3-oxo-tetronate kinase [Hoeflea prorocentri]|uniref:3-oxo-tetronate kinase n=1 Tax=Hoeflea prorocentri TaxID=1922333 RepID=A0A9X3UGW5_9HYPH|nr:3-oxo-tetronate kinase [Hoeflea prorocentri]MCY6381153.1 four-carbon acid sugar kinase family protein [Hoeflea prorocentri]MDA5398953.1 four-carbon acid sugar kinase family protein [Hoeflea prorocentri]